ncbi:hypothetical protein ACTOJ1_000985 [Shigella flexneri]
MRNIKVVFYVGLPGSGKTTLLSKIKKGFIIDDFSLNIEKLEEFKDSEEEILYIADPMLCTITMEEAERSLSKMLFGLTIKETEWFLFENNLEDCYCNVKRRDDNREINKGFMEYLAKKYKENYSLEKAIAVYKKDN